MLNSLLKFRGLDGNLPPLDRAKIILHNLICCQPPNNELDGDSEFEKEVIEHCRFFLEKVIPVDDPTNNVIVTFGNLPMKLLTGLSGDAKRHESISFVNGFVFNSPYGWVLPTYEPTYLRRGATEFFPVVADHLRRAFDLSRGANGDWIHHLHPSYKPPNYTEYPSLDDANSYTHRVLEMQHSPRAALVYDIETPMSGEQPEEEREWLDTQPIKTIQFSLERNTGLCFPYSKEYNELARKILASKIVKVGHNVRDFDNPKLRANNFEINGHVVDTMWLYHRLYGDEPRGLQNASMRVKFPFAWKHMFSEKLEWYGCADVDAPRWVYEEIPKIMKGLKHDNGVSVWEGYLKTCYKWQKRFEAVSKRGIPINETIRNEVVTKWLVEEIGRIDGELQEMVPDEVRNISPKRKRKEELDARIMDMVKGEIKLIAGASDSIGKSRSKGKEIGVRKSRKKREIEEDGQMIMPLIVENLSEEMEGVLEGLLG